MGPSLPYRLQGCRRLIALEHLWSLGRGMLRIELFSLISVRSRDDSFHRCLRSIHSSIGVAVS
jgi:hypothetical protein